MNSIRTSVLPHASFCILFALSLRQRHGYEIIDQVSLDSKKLINLSSGTLYGAIKNLLHENYIEEVPVEESDRRKYYRLTRKGWDKLSSDVSFYRSIVELSNDRRIR